MKEPARQRRCRMSDRIIIFKYFLSFRLDIFSDLFGRPIRTNIHTYVNMIGPNYELANEGVKAKGERRKAKGKGMGGRCRPWAVVPSRKGGVVRGIRDFADASASRLILYQTHQYFGSAVAVETLYRPPAHPSLRRCLDWTLSSYILTKLDR